MEQLKEQIAIVKEIVKKHRDSYNKNEQSTRTQLIEPILKSLGWDSTDPNTVKLNEKGEDGKIPDYTLYKDGDILMFVEAKNLSVQLQNKSFIDQLSGYCYDNGIDFGILTNGINWLLYKTFESNPVDRIVWEINLERDSDEDIISNLTSFNYKEIDKLEDSLEKRKLLDDGWNHLVKSTDSIVSIIANSLQKEVRTKHKGFKISREVLEDFTKNKIKDLFEIEEIKEEEEEDITESTGADTKIKGVEDLVFKTQKRRQPRKKISVTFSDGTIINHPKVIDTFVETIMKIGAEKVANLEIYRLSIPIVSTEKDSFYQQKKVGKYFILAQTSTEEKLNILTEINKKLGLKLKITTFTPESK